MMRRLAFSTLLAATLLGASEYNYEISPMVGYAIPNDGQWLKNHGVYGAEMQFNGVESALKPELSTLYSNADYDVNGAGDTNIFRTAINGVYEFEKSTTTTPFVKVGLGYETMNNTHFGNHNGPFADAGVGIKIALTEQIALKLEAIKTLKSNNCSFDNNLLLLAGLSFSFGEKEQEAAAMVTAPPPEPVPAVVPVAEPSPVIVAPLAIVPLIDSDNDGVVDSQDKCPNTPAGFKVGTDGCPLKATLPVHFAFDSIEVDETGMAKINEFSIFMKESPAYDAIIIGHADSTGPTEYNQKLSERRAEKVKSLLTDKGIRENRLSTRGEGEKMPIATNKTKEGRAANRRIEVDLRQ